MQPLSHSAFTSSLSSRAAAAAAAAVWEALFKYTKTAMCTYSDACVLLKTLNPRTCLMHLQQAAKDNYAQHCPTCI